MEGRLTFKKDPYPSGLASIGFTPGSDIKVAGKAIGRISAPKRHSNENYYSVMLGIIKDEKHDDGNANCEWMWLGIGGGYKDMEEARDWFKSVWPEIKGEYKFYAFGD